MRICMVAEGCYPYVVGGVSSWIHSMIKAFPDIEFIILAIAPDRSKRGKFVYELPENVAEVYEAYLEDVDWEKSSKFRRTSWMSKKEYRALRSIILNQEVDWETLFDLFQKKKFSIDDLLMGADFLHIVQECYKIRYPHIVFSDFLWTMRSIYLPFFLILKTNLPKADIYHCVATGYAGILGSMAKYKYHCGLLVSEHGIYTREREEELLKATWVAGMYKNIWIDQFRKMSQLAYTWADKVTSLYAHARQLQLELGCDPGKTLITPNGIDVSRFADLPGKKEEDEGFVNIGAVLRVTPIKDVKTMIRAFAFAKEDMANLKLWVMGPTDEDEEYAKECFDLVQALGVKDVIFTGRIDVREYLGRMDFTILTSISEGQPLTILEGYAAHKPAIATDVGNCRGLIYGESDDFGPAGILTHIMNTDELKMAMVEMGRSPQKRLEMGESGYKRVMNGYQISQMRAVYARIYEELGWEYGAVMPEQDKDSQDDDYKTESTDIGNEIDKDYLEAMTAEEVPEKEALEESLEEESLEVPNLEEESLEEESLEEERVEEPNLEIERLEEGLEKMDPEENPQEEDLEEWNQEKTDMEKSDLEETGAAGVISYGEDTGEIAGNTNVMTGKRKRKKHKFIFGAGKRERKEDKKIRRTDGDDWLEIAGGQEEYADEQEEYDDDYDYDYDFDSDERNDAAWNYFDYTDDTDDMSLEDIKRDKEDDFEALDTE